MTDKRRKRGGIIMELNEKLQELRKQKGLTQENLAKDNDTKSDWKKCLMCK